MRISSVAVRPMMSFALAVSCTPGSWTTTRSAPCCWITGSATPSSLTRLCSVVMFCVIAADWTRLAASGFRLPASFQSTPSWLSTQSKSVSWSTRMRARRRQRRLVAEADDDAVAVARDAGVADVLVAQQRAHVAGGRVGLLGQRRLHVDLHQEVDAAAQVEAEVHRQRVQRGQPARRARQQVEGDDVGRIARVGIERRADRVLGLSLRVEVGEARLDRVAVELDEVGLEPGLARGSARCAARATRRA